MYFFAEHAEKRQCKSSEYMNLYFKVKWFYNTYIADVPPYRGSIPEFPTYGHNLYVFIVRTISRHACVKSNA